MSKIICLANSRKNVNRCIAGVTSEGEWIRPVSSLRDGSITWRMREIGGTEPELLDVLSIPLEDDGPDFGHQPENRLLNPGKWQRMGRATASEVAVLCEKLKVLLHTDSDRVAVGLIAAMAAPARKSLQLIEVRNAGFYTTTSIKGKRQVRARFAYSGKGYNIVVTDPVVERRVKDHDPPGRNCILTVSMGGPYEGNYFKFIAAVIEV